MEISADRPMTLSDAVVCLEDGDRLLLCHSAALMPVYLPRGKGAARRFLADVEGLTREEVVSRFPGDVRLFDLLASHGILVPVSGGDLAGRAMARSFADNAGDRRSMAVYLLMSQECNLSCTYCLNGKETCRERTDKMPGDVACRAVRRALEQVATNGRVEVIFFGGEPLLHWEGIKDTVRRLEAELRPSLAEKTFTYHLTSNFTLLPDDFIEWARRHQVSLLCDIDGPAPVHDRCRPFPDGGSSYGVTVSNLRELLAAGLPVSIRATITALNVDGMEDIARLHRELGGTASLLVPVNPMNSDGEFLSPELLPDVDTLLSGMKSVSRNRTWAEADTFPFNVCGPRLNPGEGRHYGCAAPYGNIWVVDVAGDAYPCTHVVGMPRYFLGNVSETDFPRTGPLLRMAQALDVDRLTGCRECGWRYLCGGGCAITREMVLMNEAAPPAVRNYCEQIHCRFETQAMEMLLWERAESAGRPR